MYLQSSLSINFIYKKICSTSNIGIQKLLNSSVLYINVYLMFLQIAQMLCAHLDITQIIFQLPQFKFKNFNEM